MYKVTTVDYEIIKNSTLFDKEAERVYKMYTHPDIKIFTIEERNKTIALCIAYDGIDNIALFHFQANNFNLINNFISYFKSKNPKEMSIFMPKLYKTKYERIFLKHKFEFVNNVHAYVFVPSLSQNLSFWKNFYSKRGHKVINYLVEHGCDRCTFEEASQDSSLQKLYLISKLKIKISNNEFDDSYNPFDRKDYDPHYSYIGYYENEPVAFLTVRNKNNILLLDHLAVSKDAKHNGICLLLISKFINHVISDYEEESDKYFEVRTKAIMENSRMHKLIEGTLNKIIFQQREKVLYKYVNTK